MKRIYIDVGHGLPDPGAVSACGGYYEAANCLEIAHQLRALEPRMPGAVFAYSRMDEARLVIDDNNRDLTERARRANEWGADVFVSIHQNADDKRQGKGLETYFWHTSTAGQILAEDIQASVWAETGLVNRGVKRGRFLVLRETRMPAVLIETGFVGGDPEEAKAVSKPEFHRAAALGIMKGLAAYLGLDFLPPKYDPQAEVNRLLEDGIINTPRDYAQCVTWGEFATLLNRQRDGRNK